MTTDTRAASDCKSSEPEDAFQNPVEGALDTPIVDHFDRLLLAQIARRCGNWTAIVCLAPMSRVMSASPARVRRGLDRLEAAGFVTVEPRECRCSGDAERYKIVIQPSKLGGR